jgi:hypothetical protein
VIGWLDARKIIYAASVSGAILLFAGADVAPSDAVIGKEVAL